MLRNVTISFTPGSQWDVYIVGGRDSHQNDSKGLNHSCASPYLWGFMRSSDEPSSFVLPNSASLSVHKQPRWGRRLSSCPWSARSSLMWYGRVILDLSNGNDSPFLMNACTRLLNWGSLSSWGDNHTCRCHTWEGPHAHCGLFGYFWNVISCMVRCRLSVWTLWFCSRGRTDGWAAVPGDLQGLSLSIYVNAQRTAELSTGFLSLPGKRDLHRLLRQQQEVHWKGELSLLNSLNSVFRGLRSGSILLFCDCNPLWIFCRWSATGSPSSLRTQTRTAGGKEPYFVGFFWLFNCKKSLLLIFTVDLQFESCIGWKTELFSVSCPGFLSSL